MLLRKGRFPADVRARLEQERLVLIAEGIPGRLTRDDGRRSGVIGALAISQQRLVVFAAGASLVDVTWDGGEARELDVTVQERGLQVGFDAERFTADRTGRVELLLHLADAPAVLAAIDQRRRPLEPRRRRAERSPE